MKIQQLSQKPDRITYELTLEPKDYAADIQMAMQDFYAQLSEMSALVDLDKEVSKFFTDELKEHAKLDMLYQIALDFLREEIEKRDDLITFGMPYCEKVDCIEGNVTYVLTLCTAPDVANPFHKGQALTLYTPVLSDKEVEEGLEYICREHLYDKSTAYNSKGQTKKRGKKSDPLSEENLYREVFGSKKIRSREDALKHVQIIMEKALKDIAITIFAQELYSTILYDEIEQYPIAEDLFRESYGTDKENTTPNIDAYFEKQGYTNPLRDEGNSPSDQEDVDVEPLLAAQRQVAYTHQLAKQLGLRSTAKEVLNTAILYHLQGMYMQEEIRVSLEALEEATQTRLEEEDAFLDMIEYSVLQRKIAQTVINKELITISKQDLSPETCVRLASHSGTESGEKMPLPTHVPDFWSTVRALNDLVSR